MQQNFGRLFTPAEALARWGLSYEHLRHEVRMGRLVRLSRGVLAQSATWLEARDDPKALHALRIEAACLTLNVPVWASDYSAAALRGWPLPIGEPRIVTLTVEPGDASSRTHRSDVRIRAARVPAGHRDELWGVPVLSRARTIVDIARLHGLAQGLVVADFARRRGDVFPRALAAALDDCSGWPGSRAARLVAKHASKYRESPLESQSFALFIGWGIALPLCNQWLGGEPLNRVRSDFFWPRHRLAGEADGRVKYDHPYDDSDSRPTLWSEKKRAEAIEDMGLVLVRWTGEEVHRCPEVIKERLARASWRANRLYGVPRLI